MARFSQAFLQSLTQPSYGKGLFEFGKGLSMAPALAAEQKQRESMMEKLANLTPLETADYMMTQAKTPEQLVAAKTARQTALSQAGKQSIDTIQAQLAVETDYNRMKELEDALVSVAQQTGNPAEQYRGTAAKKLKAQGEQSISVAQQVYANEPNADNLTTLTRSIEQVALQTGNDPIKAVADARAARQDVLEAKETAIREGFTTAYYASLNSPEQNEALLQNMRQSGFSDLAIDLETKNEKFIKLRNENDANAAKNKPLTENEISGLRKQVELIDDESTRKRYEAAVDSLAVLSKNTPAKARDRYGLLITDIAKIAPKEPKETKDSLLPDPTKDEIELALTTIKDLKEDYIGDEQDLGFITLNSGEWNEKQVLIDDILDGDAIDAQGNDIDVDINDLARVVAAQQKQDPEIPIDVAIKRAAESFVLGKKIGKKGTTTSINSDDVVVDFGTLKQ